jgi:hypothetical protein
VNEAAARQRKEDEQTRIKLEADHKRMVEETRRAEEELEKEALRETARLAKKAQQYQDTIRKQAELVGKQQLAAAAGK